MDNFVFYSPTEFVFGKETESMAGKLLKKYSAEKVLLLYGGGSVIKSGLMSRVEESLKNEGVSYITLGGVQPNPLDTKVYEGIELCRKDKVDFILAVGGGSVIDTAKAIAAGAPYDGDFWDFYNKGMAINSALKVATVLTIPAAGSEGSGNSVITKEEGSIKLGTGSPLLRPVFSVMNPVLTYTLPPYQTACGIADMMAHVMERYFTNTEGVEISSRLSEAVLQTIIKEAPVVMNEPENYDARANIMWAGTIAHNGTCGVGREEDWATHLLEHELSALYNVTHGAGLAVMFPAWMTYLADFNPDMLAQYAVRVWGIPESDDKKAVALKGVEALKNFFSSIGLPVSFKELGAKEEDIDLLVKRLHDNKGEKVGFFKKLTREDSRKIYQIAAR
ncbi:MAG: iron-containing alcohol dehydrogenase [Bacteroidetes bacterium]|nr:iron-containing alcohol dehydrogenase [Bacteroidota bacterium]